MQDPLDRDDPLFTPPRKTGLAGLLQRIRATQPVPEPFRDSDFDNGDWTLSAFEAPSRTAE